MNQDPNTNPTPEFISLPEGYSFVEKADISPLEVMTLRESVGWTPETAEKWQDCIDESIEVAGVRDASGKLVGVGFLVGNKRHAVLCDLVVDPEHQGKGLGTAILKKRMDVIEKLEIPYVYTDLAATNPLRDQYARFGFVATQGSLFRNRITHSDNQ